MEPTLRQRAFIHRLAQQLRLDPDELGLLEDEYAGQRRDGTRRLSSAGASQMIDHLKRKLDAKEVG